MTEEQSILSTSPGIERARGEIGKLLAGQEYAPEVFDCSDVEIRKFIGASLLAALNNGQTGSSSRAQTAYLDHGYFDDTARELRSSVLLPERLAALERLVRFGGSLATLHLIATLYDTSPEVRRAAVAGLGSLRDPEALLALNELLTREESELLPAGAIQYAIDAINRVDSNVRPTAALCDPESEPPQLLEIDILESQAATIDLSALIESEIYPDDGDVSVDLAVAEHSLSSEEEALAHAVATVERRRQEVEGALLQTESDLRAHEEPAENEARNRWQAVEERDRLEPEATRRRDEEEARLRAERQARSLVEEEARRLAEEEAQIRNEAESLRQAQQEVALRRAELTVVRVEEERQHKQDEARQKLEEAQLRNAAFEEELAQVKQETLAQADREEQLRLELEAVNRAGEAQRSRIEEAEARLRAEHEDEVRIEMEALRRAGAEQRERIESAAAMRAAEEVAHRKAATEAREQDQEERSRIEQAFRLEAEARKQRLAELDSLRLRFEQENQAGAEEEKRLESALLSLEQARAEQQQRIATAEALRLSEEAELLEAAEDARSRDERERQRMADATRVAAEAWQQRRTELQDMHARAEKEADLQAAEEANLRTSLETLQTANEQQRKSLREAEQERAAAEAEQAKGATEARERDEEHHRRLSEAVQHAAETHQLRMTGLADLQAQADRELEEQANEETRWRSTIDSLHAAVEEQRQRIAALEADRATAEAAQLKEAEDARQRDAEKRQQLATAQRLEAEARRQRLTELEALCREAQQSAEALSQEETRLKSDLYALRHAIAEQQHTNDELKSQREHEETQLREATEVARARDEESALRLSAALQEQEAAARQRQSELEALNSQLNKESELQTAEHKRLMNELSAQREHAVDQSRLYIAQEEQLRADIDSLCQGNADRWRMIEELKSVQGAEESNRLENETRILELASVQRRRIKDARRRTEDEEQRLGELHRQRAELETQAESLEREVRQVQQDLDEAAKQIEEHQGRGADLDALRAQCQEQTRKNAEDEGSLLAELESIRLQVAEQTNRHNEREQEILGAIESQRGLEAELQQRMAELESAGAALKTEAEARENLEHQVRAQIEAQGRLEAEQDARLEELETSLSEFAEHLKKGAQREERIRLEIEKQRRLDEEQRQRIAELEAVHGAEEAARIEAARAQVGVKNERRNLKAARKRSDNEERRLSELQGRRAQVDEELRRRRAEANQTEQELEAVQKSLAEELRISEDAEALQSAASLERLQAAEAVRLRVEAECRRVEELVKQQIEQTDEARWRLNEAKALHAAQEERLSSCRVDEQNVRAEIEELQLEIEQQRQPVGEVDSLKDDQDPELLLAEADTAEQLSSHNDREEQLLSEIEQLRLTIDEQKHLLEEAESIHRIHLEEVKAVQTSSSETKSQVNSLESEPSADTKEIKLFELTAPQSGSPAPWVDVDLFEQASAGRKLPPPTAIAESNREAATEEKSLALADEALTLEITLRRQLNSKDPTERSAALVDLARLGGDDVFALIVKSFDDPSPQVRNTAARALYDFGPDRAASFTRALRESSFERKRRIGAALAGSGLATSAISGLAGESRERMYTAYSLLFLMSKAGEVQPLIETVEEHPNLETRLTAVTLLALSGQPEVDPAFRRLAVRGSLPSQLRSAVMAAMHQINEARHGLRSLA